MNPYNHRFKFLLPVCALIFASSTAFANSGGTNCGSDYVGDYNPEGSNVVIDSDFSSGSVYGGKKNTSGESDDVSENTVTVTNGKIGSDSCGTSVYGGASADGNAKSNRVKISGGTVTKDVFGGEVSASGKGSAMYNSVTISGGCVNSCVYGGSSGQNGNVTNNTVTISGGTVQSSVYGGSGAGAVSGNSVTISGGNVASQSSACVYGGKSTNAGTVSGNSVTISGGILNCEVYGGYSHSGTATGNIVTITGGELKCSVQGGYANGEATNNSVTISGGTVKSVYGGQSVKDKANNNTVTITGGTVTGSVYGGLLNSSGSGSCAATNNTIIVYGNPSLSELWGGGGGQNSPDVRSGNTLEVHTSGLTLKKIANFENYNFFLPATVKSGDTILTITDTTETDISNSTVAVAVEGSSGCLYHGDKVTLISASAGLKSDGYKQGSLAGRQGVSLDYKFTLDADGNALYANVVSVNINPNTKALSEGYLAGAILALQGADLVADSGMTEAVKAGSATTTGIGGFAAVSAGSLRYNTGSHVDMKSFSLMAGVSEGFDGKYGHFTFGGFVEYGNGSYDTYNSFSNAASVDGDGSSWYTGGGLLARMDFVETGTENYYLEASVRLGRLDNSYNSDDLRDSFGQTADYDADSTYVGFHIGGGMIFTLSKVASLDLYGKYFYTWQEEEDTKLSTGESLKFSDVSSCRLRLGARVRYDMNASVNVYVGAAWEREFDGEVNATTNGFPIDAPSTEGNTGIGEIGVAFKPSETSPLTIDLGIQGYVGKREGVTGSGAFHANIKYEF